MKDVVVRAFKTFIQAAISYVCTISFIDIDWSDNTVVGGVILAALAAGISALMNIDWDAISLEKAVEEVGGEAEDDAADADALDEESEDVDSEDVDEDADIEEEDAADDTLADESAEDETLESAAAEADAEDADTSDADTSDEDTTETETEKACG